MIRFPWGIKLRFLSVLSNILDSFLNQALLWILESSMGVFTSKALPSGCKELSSGNLSQPIRDEQNMKFHVQVFPSAVGLIDSLSALPSRFFHFRNELNDTESTEVTRIFTLHFPTLPMPINRSYPPDMDAGAVWLPENMANFSWSTQYCCGSRLKFSQKKIRQPARHRNYWECQVAGGKFQILP